MPKTLSTVSDINHATYKLQTQAMNLASKVQVLGAWRSDDPLQQLQTEAIIDLYNALMTLQDVTAPLMQALLPSVDKAKQAAERGHHDSVTALARPFYR